MRHFIIIAGIVSHNSDFIGIQRDVTTEVEAVERVRELEAEVAELKRQLAER